MWVMLGALALPLVEIALFILVGGWIGVWPTLGLVALSGLVGVMILRGQGAGAVAAMRQAARLGADPGPLLARGALRVFAAFLLIVPGFLTGAIALALLIPATQRALLRLLRARMPQAGRGGGPGANRTARPVGPAARPVGDVIEAEFEEIAPEHRPTHQPPEWTRH